MKPRHWAAIAASVYVLWLLVLMGGGGSWAIFVYILLAFVWVVLFAVLLPVFALAAKARRLRRESQPWRGPALGTAAAALAVLVALAGVFHLMLPDYFRPAYEEFHTRHDPARDFTAPWGARMIALDFAPWPYLNWPARTMWVAETELTRGQYAKLMGTAVSGNPDVPYTSLSRADVGAILLAMNGASRPPDVAEGKYRVPGFMEATAYSGDWWINRHRKSVFSCEKALEPAASFAPNGIGLRGTVENAAELVIMDIPNMHPTSCVMQGGLPPHCGYDDGHTNGKSVSTSACDDRSADKVWSAPSVGLRVVYGSWP